MAIFPKFRIPITVITVFGTSALLLITVSLVLLIGFGQVVDTTRQLWADQSKNVINDLEKSLATQLSPVRTQALWISQDIDNLSEKAKFDDFIFGSLAATPQVAGIAIISTDGHSRRWHRTGRVAIDEDWSEKAWMESYLQQVEAAAGPTWREPVFNETVEASTLLHDVPLYGEEGQFVGILAQIIPVAELSSFLIGKHSNIGITPFILYQRDQVLVHPQFTEGTIQQILPTLKQLDDPILQKIWTPNDNADFISPLLENVTATGYLQGDDYFLYLYREIEKYGPAGWTIGVYIDTNIDADEQTEKIIEALIVGLLVLVLGLIISIVVGRRVSSPIKALVKATEKVNAGHFDGVSSLPKSRIRELDDAGYAFNRMVDGLKERQVIRDTLGRFVPEKIASSLLTGGGAIPVVETEATILFCDIEAFTQLTERLGPIKTVDVLNAYFSDMVDILEQEKGVVTQFQGDAILATFNVPIANLDHANHAISAALKMLQKVEENHYVDEKLAIRIGINTGKVVAGAIGAKGRLNYTVHGDAVNLAARLESLNKEYGTRILVSESTRGLSDSALFVEIGETKVRGQSGTTHIFTCDNVIP